MVDNKDDKPEPPVVPKEIPDGKLRAFECTDGDILIGLSNELPDKIIIHILPGEVALVIPLEMAYNIHDGLCTAINILDEGASLDVDKETIPTDKSKWN